MSNERIRPELPIPPHFEPENADEVWKVPYEQRAKGAERWAEEHDLSPAVEDDFKIALICVDTQNTFCLPDFELYVAGRSGTGAIDDTRRMAEFIYKNLANLTEITATIDTHQAMQIFHAIFLIDDQGQHPNPMTLVTAEDIRQGRWKFNPAVAPNLGIDAEYGQKHLQHYVDDLERKEKFALTIAGRHRSRPGIDLRRGSLLLHHSPQEPGRHDDQSPQPPHRTLFRHRA